MKSFALILFATMGLSGALSKAMEPPKPLFECRASDLSTQRQIAIIVQPDEVIVFQASPQTRYTPLHFVTKEGTYQDISGPPHFSCAQSDGNGFAISIDVYENAVHINRRSGDAWYQPLQYDIIGAAD